MDGADEADDGSASVSASLAPNGSPIGAVFEQTRRIIEKKAGSRAAMPM